MDQTVYQVPPGFVWPTVGHPGRVPLWSVVPNPNQPRTDSGFEDEAIDSLAETMDPSKGGEQREIVTVRELYPHEREEYPAHVRYMAISGERRWRAAQRASLVDLEIRVKAYKSHVEEDDDMYMLNEKRVGLSDIERARYLARIMNNHKFETQAELANHVGDNQTEISQLLLLLKTTPAVQALMSPKIPMAERLKREVGLYYSRLKEDTQDALVKEMPTGRVTTSQQIRWLEKQLRGTEEEQRPVQHKPIVLRRLIGYFSNHVEQRAQEILEMGGLDLLFANTDEVSRNELLGKLGDAENNFNELLTKIRALAKAADANPVRTQPDWLAKRAAEMRSGAGKTIPAPVLQQVPVATARPVPLIAPVPRAAPTQQVLPSRAMFGSMERAQEILKGNGSSDDGRVVINKPKPAPPSEPTIGRASPPLNYYDKKGWVRGASVDWATYMRLWREESLEFQVLGKTKPDDLPTLQEVQHAFAAYRT